MNGRPGAALPLGGAARAQALAQFHVGLAHLQAGRPAQARALFADVAVALPREADPRRALAEAFMAEGDLAAAEREARAALSLDRRTPHAHLTLAAVLVAAGRAKEAEKALRNALALDRRFIPAALRLSELLRGQGRLSEAAQVTAPLAAAARDAVVLSVHGDTLKALARPEEALAAYCRWVEVDPHSAVAEHNVASALADLRRDAEALAATDRAIAKGGSAPETWLVRGHALQGLDRFEEAQAAYEEAVRRRPDFAAAVDDLAKLIWMRTGDLARALAPFDRAIAFNPGLNILHVAKAKLLDYAGDKAAAYSALAPALRTDADAFAHVAAAQIAGWLDPERAGRHAETALARDPTDWRLQLTLAETRLAQGRAAEAVEVVARVLEARPHEQGARAVQATALRMQGDAGYAALHDYPAFVRTYTLEPPPGWSDLETYLCDLAAALKTLHGLTTHPVGQSLRQGTQTSRNLLLSDDPAIKGFFQAIDAPIRAHMAALGKGRDPVRSRNTGRYGMAGAWSVRLQPGGRHVDHVHTQGWLSSAFYVELPQAVAAGGREGWIKFGQPGLPTAPPLAAEHYVKPEPGRLVLFPSYMWHGTEPFGGAAARLTMAFDVVPR